MACDIYFNLPLCTTTNESTPGAADGTITAVAAGSTGGTKEYNLGADFTYGTGSTSGVFTALVAGSYTVYARSSADCLATLDILVVRDTDYNLRYTNDYYDIAARQRYKFEIYKRDYSGSSEVVDGSFVITQGIQSSEDPFQTIYPSSCAIELMSHSNEEFLELYTDDEREYKVICYVWLSAAWSVMWTGYGITGQYEAEYVTQSNYPILFTAADMLENLKDIPFGNSDGQFPQGRMSIMQGILMALRHTDIELDVYEGVQLVIDGVTDSFDATSALETAYFDPGIYNTGDEPESCYDVLDSLLRSMIARLYQAYGRWVVEMVTMKAGGAFNVRTRDFTGAETGAGYLETEPRLLVRKSSAPSPRLVFSERSQRMKILQTYGTVSIVYKFGLNKENNILPHGDFVDVDIDNGQLKNWTIDTSLAPLTPAEIVSVQNGDQTVSSLKFTFINGGISTTQLIVVESDLIHIEDTGEDITFRISFDVLMGPAAYYPTKVYTYFDYSVSYLNSDLPGDLYVLATFDPDTGSRAIGTAAAYPDNLIDDEWIRVYVDDPNKLTNISFDVTIREVSTIGSGDFQIRFRMGANPTYDYDDEDDLKAEPTLGIVSTQTFNNRRKLRGQGTETGNILLYTLEPGTDATSYPDVLRPDDYGGSNSVIWKLQSRVFDIDVTPTFRETWLTTAIIKGAVVSQYLPDGVEPEESATEVAILREHTKFDLEVPLRHADLPADTNYGPISKGWLSFSDLTPTETWQLRTAAGGSPAKALINQIADAYRGQYDARRYKLTGSWDDRQVVPSFFNTFLELITGKVYVPSYLILDTRQAMCGFEMIEVLQGTAIPDTGQVVDPANPGEDIEPPDPAAGRIHTEAYASAYI